MVLTPKGADKADRDAGIIMLIGCVFSYWAPATAICLILYAGFLSVCVAIDRHLGSASIHRRNAEHDAEKRQA